ncbi:MAG: tRNA epoxyqueuosine(34) reductase QueG [Deltaproteobacteria bacterium]|nr:tRNA epoxyqueuosine(34) reductase QueG [Deltaproteobacteria bacterium]
MDIHAQTRAVRQAALDLGFDRVGFARAAHMDPDQRLRRWLDHGFAAEMHYMHRTADVRVDPRRLLPGARSVVALMVSYDDGRRTPVASPSLDRAAGAAPSPPFKVSRYVTTRDYHRVIQKLLRKLRRRILEIVPDAKVHPSVDTSPVMERAWAERAGIAWIGKSTMAINPTLGTYTFLASLVTDLEFVYDDPHPDRCGHCTRCLSACPTDAFRAPYTLDARRCIGYWTVEKHEGFNETTPEFHEWVAGCDICQEVCPWNKFSQPPSHEGLRRATHLAALAARDWLEPSPQGVLEAAIQGTALQRTGAERLRNNATRIAAKSRTRPADDRDLGEGLAEGEDRTP